MFKIAIKISALIFLIGVTFATLSEAHAEDKPDYSTYSTEKLTSLHEAGDIEATFVLGYNYFFQADGNIRESVSNIETGLSYLEHAHKEKHPNANTVLSTIYYNGLFDQNVDIERAHKYSLEGALNGSSGGKLNYGIHNVYSSTEEIAVRARGFLIDVADEDGLGGPANENLMEVYYFGTDVFEENFEAARLFAENCVTFGDSLGRCEFLLARDFQNGWGGEKDAKRSADLFLKGAEDGDAKAMWYAAMNLLENGNSESNVAAFEWVKKSADAEYIRGIISLATMHALGQGTEIDYGKAYATYQQAADLKSAHAIRSMASMHCAGEGREKDREICASGLILAYEHGDNIAFQNLRAWFDVSEKSFPDFKANNSTKSHYWVEKYEWLSAN